MNLGVSHPLIYFILGPFATLEIIVEVEKFQVHSLREGYADE